MQESIFGPVEDATASDELLGRLEARVRATAKRLAYVRMLDEPARSAAVARHEAHLEEARRLVASRRRVLVEGARRDAARAEERAWAALEAAPRLERR